MPAAQQVAFQPAFDGVLAEHLHDAAFGRQIAAVGILREVLCQPHLLGDIVEGLQPVGLRLVRPEDAEVVHVQPHDFAQEIAEGGDVAGQGCAGFLDLDGGVAEVRHVERLAQQTAIGDRVGAHPPVPLGASAFRSGMSRPSSSKSSSGS